MAAGVKAGSTPASSWVWGYDGGQCAKASSKEDRFGGGVVSGYFLRKRWPALSGRAAIGSRSGRMSQRGSRCPVHMEPRTA